MNEHHAVLIRAIKPDNYELPEVEEGKSRQLIQSSQFGIGDVRKLIEASVRKPMGDATSQEIVVVTSFITIEAQQALLKIVEEPPVTTEFVFVVPTSLQLLPTLLSRFAIPSETPAALQVCDLDPFVAFKEADVAARLGQIESAVKAKDQAWQTDIRCGLISYLGEHKTGRYSKVQLESLLFVAQTLQTRGASNKMLLEQLAVTL